jgi:hypothetical protein
MALELEARPYGPDSTPEEIQAIKARITVFRSNILMYYEAPVQSEFQLGLFGERMHELSEGMEYYDLLIDLTAAKPPSALVREQLRKLFGSQPKLRRAAVYTGRNFMLNVAARFVLGSIGLKDYSIYKTQADAVAALEHGA